MCHPHYRELSTTKRQETKDPRQFLIPLFIHKDFFLTWRFQRAEVVS